TWSIALATEDDHPIAETDEVWFDPATKLYRVVGTWDGRRQFDLVGREACFGPPGGQGKEFCIPPGPFSDREQAPRWPLDPRAGSRGNTTFLRIQALPSRSTAPACGLRATRWARPRSGSALAFAGIAFSASRLAPKEWRQRQERSSFPLRSSASTTGS